MSATAGGPGAHTPLHPSRQTCSECGEPLDVLQAVRGTCARPACRTRQAVRAAEERDRRLRLADEKERARSEALTARLVRDGALPRHRHYAVFAVPANTARLAAPDPERLALFRAHLDTLLDAVAPWLESAHAENDSETPDAGAGTDTQDADPEPSAPDARAEAADAAPDNAPAPPVLERHACATCRGRCCSRGGTHAFLGEETMLRWFANHPGADADRCRAAYLERLEGASYEDSCVFHGARGCRLDRDMRADLCNTWRCRRLVNLSARQAHTPASAGSLVAFDEGRAVRLRLVDAASGEELGEHDLRR